MSIVSENIAAPDPLELAIARISDAETPDDEVFATLDKLDFILEHAKRLKIAGEASMTERVKSKGTIDAGQYIYVLSRDKKVKIRDKRAVAEAVLEATAGDIDTFAELLASEPFKQGGIKQLVGEAKHAELYETIIDEYAEKKLKKIDKRFFK